ncbi:MAG: DUF6268 family outer membrane beta-barrel protein [Gemmataceae bacterium]
MLARSWIPLSLALYVCASGAALGQEAPPPSATPFRTLGALGPTRDGERNVDATPVSRTAPPLIADTDSYPATAPPAAPPWRLFKETRFDVSWLPRFGTDGLGATDLELSTTLEVPIMEWASPLLVTPYAAAHYWTAPRFPRPLPSELYDLSVEFAWRPRPAEWLFLDLALTPGLYTDWSDVSDGAFRLRGRAMSIFAFSPKLQVAAGAMCVNRNSVKLLPAGGVIWNPSDDTRFFLVFPQPKISHRIATFGATQLWAYLAGEFGGGRWEIERPGGGHDSLDYTDARVILGLESAHGDRLKGRLDIGYVFARRINIAGDPRDYHPEPTLLVRAGLRF